MSVRDDPVLFLQPGKKATGGASVLGGNATSTTGVHRLDGPEHTAAEDTTRLDASTERHGLMPKLSGNPSDALRGDGTWSPPGDGIDDILDIPTTETDSSLVLAPDGLGGVEFRAETGGAPLPWFIVTDSAYGAVGDGSTDDTAAINLAIAALNTATSGVLYFPSGTYKVTSALTTITAHVLVLGDGHGYGDSNGSGLSEINFTSQTATLLSLTGTGSQVENIALRNTYAGTPSAGAAINAQADFVQYRNISVSGFYDNIDHQDGGGWRMTGCWNVGPVRYGLRVRDVSSPDGGDQAISDSWFYADQRNSSAAIRLESGGGLKITNSKINKFVSGHQFAYGIDIVPAAAVATTILLVSNVSIENYTSDAVRYSSSAGGTWDMLSFIALQIGQYGNSSGKAFNIDGADDVVITHCILRSNTGTTTAVSLSNGDRALIGPFINHGYTTQLATSSYTNVDDRTSASGATFAAPTIALGSSAASGAASTVIRSDSTIAAFDATSPTTQALGDSAVVGTAAFAARRDHKHAMPALSSATPLVESGSGSAGTAVPSSREDHVHPAAASTSTSSGSDHEHMVDVFAGDGSTTAFEITDEPQDPEAVVAFVAGAETAVTMSGTMNTTATFGAAPSAAARVVITYPAAAA